MEGTEEIFATYEEYIARYEWSSKLHLGCILTIDRLEYYRQVGSAQVLPTANTSLTRQQRKFTCEISGHTNLTYFDALRSEVGVYEDAEVARLKTITDERRPRYRQQVS